MPTFQAWARAPCALPVLSATAQAVHFVGSAVPASRARRASCSPPPVLLVARRPVAPPFVPYARLADFSRRPQPLRAINALAGLNCAAPTLLVALLTVTLLFPLFSSNFCGPGSIAPNSCGGSVLWCAPGSSTPSVVAQGNYSTPEGVIHFRSSVGPSLLVHTVHGDECTGAPFATTRAGEAICPLGWSCSGGLRSPCSPGTFSSRTGQSVCANCMPGTFANGTATDASGGVSSCGACTAGFACGPATASPAPCGAGTYSNVQGLSACLACPFGSYNNGSLFPSAVISCNTCPLAAACPTGSTAPLPCDSGSYGNDTGLGVCTSCEAGRFSSNPSSTICALCQPGSYCARGKRHYHVQFPWLT